jgi:hypothetical protein
MVKDRFVISLCDAKISSKGCVKWIVNTTLSTEINIKIEFKEASTSILVKGIAIESLDAWKLVTLLLRLIALNLIW